MKYRLYALLHWGAKRLIGRYAPNQPFLLPPQHVELGSNEQDSKEKWHCFIQNSIIKEGDFAGTHFAGYIAEKRTWCLSSWIWTNAAIVRLLCKERKTEAAKVLADELATYQQACGGWVVRNDYDKTGAIPVLAPNDSAYIANNAFLQLYQLTGESKYLDIAKHCADWIIETSRPDYLVYTGYNMRDEKWEKDWVIVDTGFTAGLLANIALLTGEKKFKDYLILFVKRYIELFFMPDKCGFCTSIDKEDHHYGGMFSRGQAWALEGLIPAYRFLKDETIKDVIELTIQRLLKDQNRSGGWPYNLTRKMMGEDCKGIPIIASNMMEWYKETKNYEIIECAQRALNWCVKHTSIKGDSTGGIFSYTFEGAIVHSPYTSCAFVYSSVYAIELEEQINNAKNSIN